LGKKAPGSRHPEEATGKQAWRRGMVERSGEKEW
jgi:hypothetical protein